MPESQSGSYEDDDDTEEECSVPLIPKAEYTMTVTWEKVERMKPRA